MQTALAASLLTPTAIAPEPTAAPTAIRTPPALPGVFRSPILESLITPHTYVPDSCQYLHDKWSSGRAAPGTIVAVIMFHSIEKHGPVSDQKNISGPDFRKLMDGLHGQGFVAITSTQLADFLDNNTEIPERSVLLLQDDRHAAANFNDWFKPYWDQWRWPVVNAWISALGSKDPVLPDNAALEKEGWVDHQAHGVVHNIPMGDESSDAYIQGELQGAIDNFQTNFHKRPIAIIWPGGGFGVRPVAAARSLGYRIGFTTNPRGPIMYNWVPLADEKDPVQPMLIPEGPMNDPRMVLPRYWPSQVLPALDAIRKAGTDAAAYAQQNKPAELEYYDIMCAGSLGPLQ